MIRIKTLLRNSLPERFQVLLKYWANAILGRLEGELGLLPSIVRPGQRVIDIGGNRGVYTYRLWKLGALVEVFEPNPACATVLAAWASSKPTVNIHTVALSNVSGTATLHIPVDAAGVEHDASASLEHADFDKVRDQLVGLRTLDSFGFQEVGFIKIDVEGHEYSVIEGAAKTIATSKPALLVEIEQRHIHRPIVEVFEKILGFGYQGFFMEIDRLIDLESFDVVRHQSMENFGDSKVRYINNFLFLYRDKLADGEYGALVNGQLLK